MSPRVTPVALAAKLRANMTAAISGWENDVGADYQFTINRNLLDEVIAALESFDVTSIEAQRTVAVATSKSLKRHLVEAVDEYISDVNFVARIEADKLKRGSKA